MSRSCSRTPFTYRVNSDGLVVDRDRVVLLLDLVDDAQVRVLVHHPDEEGVVAEVGVDLTLLERDQAVGALVDQHRDRASVGNVRGDRPRARRSTSIPSSCTRAGRRGRVVAPMPESSRTRNRWRAVKYSELNATSFHRSHVIEIALMARSTFSLGGYSIFSFVVTVVNSRCASVAVREDRPCDLAGRGRSPARRGRPYSGLRDASPGVFSSTATRSLPLCLAKICFITASSDARPPAGSGSSGG